VNWQDVSSIQCPHTEIPIKNPFPFIEGNEMHVRSEFRIMYGRECISKRVVNRADVFLGVISIFKERTPLVK